MHSMLRPRWLPQKNFPPYAYLPGKKPHPVRDPTGHSYHVEHIPVAAGASLDSDAFLWGLDLFNHGYYWEAHEAWEGLWQVADRDGPLRMLLKGLILLSAAGIKIREGKHAAAVRHTGRAAALLRRLMNVPDRAFERALGMSPATLAEYAEAATRRPADLQETAPGQPQPVFNFILGSISRGRRSGSQKEKQSSTGSAPSGKRQCVIFTAADGGDDRARTQEIEQEGQERIPGLAARNGRALWPGRYNGDQAHGRHSAGRGRRGDRPSTLAASTPSCPRSVSPRP